MDAKCRELLLLMENQLDIEMVWVNIVGFAGVACGCLYSP